MANRNRDRLTGAEGMLRAVWDTIADLENDYQVTIVQRWIMSDQKGVFMVQLTAVSEHPLDGGTTLEAFSFFYPNASAVSFEAQLFRAVNQLALLLSSRPIPYRPTE